MVKTIPRLSRIENYPALGDLVKIVCCVALLLAAFLLAQQQEQPPPPSAPPTFPQPQAPGQMAPPSPAPPEETVSGQRVQTLILQWLRAQPSLADKNVNRRRTTIIVLTGTVDTMAHSNLAVRERRGDAGSRKIGNTEVRHET